MFMLVKNTEFSTIDTDNWIKVSSKQLTNSREKQPPELFHKKAVLKSFSVFT